MSEERNAERKGKRKSEVPVAVLRRFSLSGV
jgi:hypothetical protein